MNITIEIGTDGLNFIDWFNQYGPCVLAVSYFTVTWIIGLFVARKCYRTNNDDDKESDCFMMILAAPVWIPIVSILFLFYFGFKFLMEFGNEKDSNDQKKG